MNFTFESETAAAICYLMLTDIPTLDPDGDLTAAFWPYELEDYAPGKTKEENLLRALEHLERAAAISEFVELHEAENWAEMERRVPALHLADVEDEQ